MSSAGRERNPAHSVGFWLAGAMLKPVMSVRAILQRFLYSQ